VGHDERVELRRLYIRAHAREPPADGSRFNDHG